MLLLQLLAAIANSEIANVTNMLGTALANMLPGRVGPDVLRYNYTQAFLPGLITAATGLSYEPCLISAGLTGDVVGRAFPSYMSCRAVVRFIRAVLWCGSSVLCQLLRVTPSADFVEAHLAALMGVPAC